MAVFAHTNGKVVLNSVDLSDHVRSVSITADGVKLDTTAMGSTYTTAIMGLKSWTLDVEFNDDFASGKVDATLWGIFNGGVSVAATYKPVNTTTSATNPEWQGNICAAFKKTTGGKVGDLAIVSVSFTGDGSLTRATS